MNSDMTTGNPEDLLAILKAIQQAMNRQCDAEVRINHHAQQARMHESAKLAAEEESEEAYDHIERLKDLLLEKMWKRAPKCEESMADGEVEP